MGPSIVKYFVEGCPGLTIHIRTLRGRALDVRVQAALWKDLDAGLYMRVSGPASSRRGEEGGTRCSARIRESGLGLVGLRGELPKSRSGPSEARWTGPPAKGLGFAASSWFAGIDFVSQLKKGARGPVGMSVSSIQPGTGPPALTEPTGGGA